VIDVYCSAMVILSEKVESMKYVPNSPRIIRNSYHTKLMDSLRSVCFDTLGILFLPE
jgi:hypothetical protein